MHSGHELKPITGQRPLSIYERTPHAKDIWTWPPQENRTKAVERRMIYVIPGYKFQPSRIRIQLNPSITVLEFRTDELDTQASKILG